MADRAPHIRRRASASRAKRGRARARARSTPRPRTRALLAIADALEARVGEILEANARDLEAGRESGLSSRADRPAARSTRRASAAMAAGVREIVALPDPVGEVLDGCRLPERARRAQGARAARRGRGRLRGAAERDDRRRRAGLKSGNAVVLRGSSSAAHSNAVLAAVAARGRRGAPGCPRARSRWSPAAAARSWPSWRRRRASST